MKVEGKRATKKCSEHYLIFGDIINVKIDGSYLYKLMNGQTEQYREVRNWFSKVPPP